MSETRFVKASVLVAIRVPEILVGTRDRSLTGVDLKSGLESGRQTIPGPNQGYNLIQEAFVVQVEFAFARGA